LAGRPVVGQGEVEEAHTRDEKDGLHFCRRRAPGNNGRTGGLSGAADHGTERDFDAPRCECVLGRRGASGRRTDRWSRARPDARVRWRTTTHGEARRAGSRCGPRERGRCRGALKHLAVALFD
jgi:hypothetical protein